MNSNSEPSVGSNRTAPKQGLRQKLVNATVFLLTVVGLTIVVVVGSVELFVARRGIESLEQEIKKTLVARGESLASSHADVFRSFVRDTALTEMHHTMAVTVERDDVVYGVFTDHEGQAWAYCSPSNPCTASETMGQVQVVDSERVARELELPPPLLPARQRSRRTLDLFGSGVIEFSEPVTVDGQLAGMLRYGISTSELQKALSVARKERRTLTVLALASTVLIVAAALLSAIWFARRTAHRITRPLYELTRAAEHLARGDRHAFVDIHSSDELEVLGTTFNKMVDELNTSYGALEENNRALAKEIDERRQAQAERSELQNHLIQSQKMEAFGQLAGGVAHDFNNILAIIVGNSELLGDLLVEKKGAPEMRQINDIIGEAADRGANLTRQLLTFARRESDNPKVVDVNGILSSFEKLIRRIVEENVQLHVVPGSRVPLVYVDPGRLEQVLMNLCVNARDAMAGGGTLTLRTMLEKVEKPTSTLMGLVPRGDYLLIEAADTGTGMTQETMARLFEPFFTTKAAGQGTGLGLATVHGIVRSAGGAIDVVSELGAGTTFRIYLPAYSGDDEQEVGQEQKGVAAGEGRTVLLCEDDDTVRSMTEHMLVRGGYEVISAGAAKVALERARERHVDILVTDVIMPEMDGSQLAEAVRSERGELPVLFVSGYTAGVLAAQKLSDDHANFLRKPFRARELLERVQQLIEASAS